MATLTASILIGESHMYDGGIQPTHQLFLSENSRPAWILVPHNLFMQSTSTSNKEKVTWIPTLENMLEDALLMIALYVLEDEKLQVAARKFIGWNYNSRLECYEIEHEKRQQLYAMCREIPEVYKIIISIFHGSTIWSKLQVLSEYKMAVEVCEAGFSRNFDPWAQKVKCINHEELEGGGEA